MAPSKESGALAELFTTISAAFDLENTFLCRAIYDQVEKASAECPSVTFSDTTLASIPCKWIHPAHASKQHILLFLHGGGYTFGSLSSHRNLAAHLSKACNATGLMVDYRLAPEHVYPAALDDCLAVYEWLLSNGHDANHIAIAGDSSGGALATSVPLAAIRKRTPVPGAAVSLSPWCDLTHSGGSIVSNAGNDALSTTAALEAFAERYTDGTARQDPLISPLFAENLGEIPPTWISCGGFDILRDDGVRLAEKARRAGAEVVLEVWEGQQHVFEFMVGKAPEADDSVKRIGEWVRKKTGNL